MSQKNIIFNDKKTDKSKFYKNKKLFKIDNIDVNKILGSKKESYVKNSSFKYFVGYNDNDNIRPLCLRFPQMTGHAKYFENNKTMSFKVIHRKLLKKYTKIREKNSGLMNKEFDSEPVYGDSDKYIETKIKSYADKINTNFQGQKIPKKYIIQMFAIDNARFCY